MGKFSAFLLGVVLLALSAGAQGYAISWRDSSDRPSAPPEMGMSSLGSMEYREGYGWRDGMIDSFRPCWSDLYRLRIEPEGGETGSVPLYLEVRGTIDVSDVRPARNAAFDGDEIFVGTFDLSVPNGIRDIDLSREFELLPEGRFTFLERIPVTVELGQEYYLNMTSFLWGEMRNVEFTDGIGFPGHLVLSNYDYAVSVDLTPVPEPATLLLLGMGLAALAGRRGRRV